MASQFVEGHDLQITSSQQFTDLIYQKQKAFFVQFYSSKDEKSSSFLSVWTKLAANVADWNNVVQIASVDCELESNADLCKEHNLKTYPTLKYFKYESQNAQDGQIYDGKKSKINELTESIARFVLADHEKQKPAGWPDFTLAHDNKPGDNLWAHDTHFMALIFETYPTDSSSSIPIVGVQTILDFSNDPDVMVRRGTSRHQLGRANDIKDFPGLLMFSRSHAGSPVYISKDSLTREEIAAKMNRYMDVTSKEHGHEKKGHDDL